MTNGHFGALYRSGVSDLPAEDAAVSDEIVYEFIFNGSQADARREMDTVPRSLVQQMRDS